jgi:hypothetical protein
MEKRKKIKLDKRRSIKYNNNNFIETKGDEGNKTSAETSQRTGGWCEPVFPLLCIAHPRAAAFDTKCVRSGRKRQRYRPEPC